MQLFDPVDKKAIQNALGKAFDCPFSWDDKGAINRAIDAQAGCVQLE